MKYLYFSLLAFLLAYQPTTQQQEQISETNAKAPVEDKAWQLVDTQNEPTARHENAFVQADGKFYLIGGRGERPVDIYDPATNTWSEGQTPPLEMHHFQAVSHEGKDYVMGGYDRQLSRRAAHSRHLYL
jgi:N-acetylneuraminic acid mutarotase